MLLLLLQDELECAGVWDIDRLTLPYMTDEILHTLFGESASAIKNDYLYLYGEWDGTRRYGTRAGEQSTY